VRRNRLAHGQRLQTACCVDHRRVRSFRRRRVLADIKTIAAFECYGVAAVTSLTFQNTRQVLGALSQTAEAVREQIAPLFEDFEIAAIKTGMLADCRDHPSGSRIIRANAVGVVVVDPVLKSTSRFDFVDDVAVDALTNDLIPLASLVTPNIAEAKRISGVDIKDQLQMERAAEVILKLGAGQYSLLVAMQTPAHRPTSCLMRRDPRSSARNESGRSTLMVRGVRWLQRWHACWREEAHCANRFQSPNNTSRRPF